MVVFLLIMFQELLVILSILLLGFVVKVSGSGFDKMFDEATEKTIFTFLLLGIVPVVGLITGFIFVGICILVCLSELMEHRKFSINKTMKKIFKGE